MVAVVVAYVVLALAVMAFCFVAVVAVLVVEMLRTHKLHLVVQEGAFNSNSETNSTRGVSKGLFRRRGSVQTCFGSVYHGQAVKPLGIALRFGSFTGVSLDDRSSSCQPLLKPRWQG